MTKTELQAKIAKMEKGLDNPNIQGAARAALEQSLKTAKEQLAGMSEPKETAPKPASAPKQAAPTKPKAKPKAAPKPKASSTAAATPEYSWQNKTDLSQLKAVSIDCQHYHLKVDQATKVSLKRTGKTSMVVTAQPGDHIIFDHEGYAVYIMEAGSFAKKCTTAKVDKPTPNSALLEYNIIFTNAGGLTVATDKNTRLNSDYRSIAHLEKDGSVKWLHGKTKSDYPDYVVDAILAQAEKESKPTATKSTAKNKAASKPKSPRKKTAPKAPSDYTKAIQSFDKEVDNIRTTYKKPEADQDQVKEDLKALAAKSGQKNYTAYVERKIKRLDKDGVRITKEEIIRIGIALRPLVQSVRGTLQDTQNTNRKVLEPTLDNLVRWSKSPGDYDLAGVDASADKKATAKVKVSDQDKKGFLAWIFGE